MTSPRRLPERSLPRSCLARQPTGEVEKVVDEVRLYRCWLLAGLHTLKSYREYRQRQSLEPPGFIRPCRPRGYVVRHTLTTLR